jgi:hypothetical protein
VVEALFANVLRSSTLVSSSLASPVASPFSGVMGGICSWWEKSTFRGRW